MGPYVTSFYPAGLSHEEAISGEGYIYLAFSHKDNVWPDLPDLLQKQNLGAKDHYRNPTIEYIDTIERKDCQTLLRVIDAEEMGNTIEYTIFLDFPKVIIYMTLLSPRDKEKEYLNKLQWTAEKLIKGNVVVNRAGKPMNAEFNPITE